MPGFFEYFLKKEQPEIADRLIKLWQNSKQKTLIEYQELNMISWLRPSKNIIVHSHFAENIVKGYLPNNKIHVIPHFAYQFGLNINKILDLQKEFKVKYGISDDEIIISSVGFINKNKQYDAIIKAFDKISSGLRANTRLIIAGEGRSSEYDLRAALQGTSAADRTMVLDYLDEEHLIHLLASSDAVINLRYPTFGESSGSIARALGCGCITIVSDGGSYKEIDNLICWKVPSKSDPSSEIALLLEKMFDIKSKIPEIRTQILNYASNNLHPLSIANQYMRILSHVS
jgi:glycosyltransferase involved in cell wall biosynthesis